MDENLRETTELPESGGTAPNEENEPETKSIRFVPSAYDPRGIEQWLSERAAEGKLLLRYDDFVIGEPRDCRYHLEPAADDDDPDELLREKRARLGWEYVCRTKDGIFYIWCGEKTAHVPTSKDCTDSYGYRTHPLTGKYSWHNGVDFGAAAGTAILATKSGTVTTASYSAAWGYYVVINHGDGYSSLYAHQPSCSVSVGDYVTQGQTIGYVGSTGWSTGPHLHFTIYYNGADVNPFNYIG